MAPSIFVYDMISNGITFYIHTWYNDFGVPVENILGSIEIQFKW